MGSVNGDVELSQWDTRSNHSHGGSSSQGSSGHGDEKIYVSIRMRPLNDKEIARNDFSNWECLNNTTVVFKNSLGERPMYPNAYHFDRVFGGECSTRQVYEQAARDIALSVVNGINSSVFAYGQTSSGKTFTMGGITRYTIDDIFAYIEQHQERQYRVKFSAMEIYNEAVRDLLSPDATPLRLLDDPERGTVVERLTEEDVMDKSYLLELIALCEDQRQTGETALNETSSRSHQIIRLSIESSVRQLLRASDTSTLAASVSFVDLAGSERASQTMTAGTRLKEGAHINRSLLTLGTVIRKLSKGRSGHVPYRDSKLTRILQNSLGGNAKTAIICTMSPAHAHLEQSRNTLLFGSCAKEVNTNAHVNVLISDKDLVKQLRKELARLEGELKYMSSNTSKSDDSSQLLKEKEQRIEKMEKELEEVRLQRDEAQLRVDQMLQSAGLSQAARKEVILHHLNGHGRKSSVLDEYSSVLSDMSDYQRLVTDLKTLEPITPLSSLQHEIDLNTDELLTINSPQFPCLPPELFASPVRSSSQLGLNKYFNIQKPTTIQEQSEDKSKEVCSVNEVDEVTKVIGVESTNESLENLSRQDSFAKTKEITISSTRSPEEYDALVNRIRELQKTIDSLVNRNQDVGNYSPCSTESSTISSYKGVGMHRSRSCKAILTNHDSSLDRPIHNLDVTFNGFGGLPSGSRRLRLSTRHSSDFSGSDNRISSTWNNSDMIVSISNTDNDESKITYDASECSTTNSSQNTSLRSESSSKYDSEQQESNDHKDVHSLANIEVMDKELQDPAKDDTVSKELQDSAKDDTLSKELHESAKDDTLSKELHESAKDDTLSKELLESAKDDTLPKELHESAKDDTLSKELLESAKDDTLSKELHESAKDDTLDSEPGDEQSPVMDNQIQDCDGNDDMLAHKSENTNMDEKDTAKGSPDEQPSDWMHGIEHKRKALGLGVTKESATETSSNWLQEFEQKQRKIIELWDACYTSIVHRSYFFLLFETVDPSDSVYIEVEIRRLSFIQSHFSRNMKITMEGQIMTPASSMKALNHERENLARQMQKKLVSKERDALFKKWGIKLDSKRRRLQLARHLWTKTKDIEHVRQSANLVAKVAGLFEEGQVPKEMFLGHHGFSPKSISRRSHSWAWKDTLPSLM